MDCCVVGKGLGRSENGISEAIKVKIKYGKGGVSERRFFCFVFENYNEALWVVDNMGIKFIMNWLYVCVC